MAGTRRDETGIPVTGRQTTRGSPPLPQLMLLLQLQLQRSAVQLLCR